MHKGPFMQRPWRRLSRSKRYPLKLFLTCCTRQFVTIKQCLCFTFCLPGSFLTSAGVQNIHEGLRFGLRKKRDPFRGPPPERTKANTHNPLNPQGRSAWVLPVLARGQIISCLREELVAVPLVGNWIKMCLRL